MTQNEGQTFGSLNVGQLIFVAPQEGTFCQQDNKSENTKNSPPITQIVSKKCEKVKSF